MPSNILRARGSSRNNGERNCRSSEPQRPERTEDKVRDTQYLTSKIYDISPAIDYTTAVIPACLPRYVLGRGWDTK